MSPINPRNNSHHLLDENSGKNVHNYASGQRSSKQLSRRVLSRISNIQSAGRQLLSVKLVGRFDARLLVTAITIAVVATVLTATAFMQERKTIAPPAEAKRVNSNDLPQEQSQEQPASFDIKTQNESGIPLIEASNNYAFSTATNGSLALDRNGNAVDLTVGATSLVTASADDTASPLTNIGFEFWFMGTRYTQFSTSDNGIIQLGSVISTIQYSLPSTTLPLIAPFGEDLRVGTNGIVRSKVVGTAPNRTLVVEYSNIMIRFLTTAAAGTGTWQARLYESTGIIEFVYGAMATNTATQAPAYIGFSSNGTTTNTFATVNTTTQTANTTGALASNTYASSSTITALNSAANGSRRIYTFIPPVPAVPTNLIFSNITATTMTLSWTDTSTNEAGFPVYISTDGTTYTFIGQAAENATSVSITGLNPNTTYFFRVFAVSEGALSTALTGSQLTAAGKQWIGVGAGGVGTDFNTPTNWSPTGVPGPGDEAVIVTTSAATILVSSNVTVSTLTMLNNTASPVILALDAQTNILTVNGNFTANVSVGGASGTHTQLRVGNSPGNITIGGTATFGNNANATSFVGFTGSAAGSTTGTITLRGDAAFGVTYGTLGGHFGNLIFDGTGTQTISTNNSFNIGINAPVLIGSTNTPTVVLSSTFAGNMALSTAADGFTVSAGSTLDLTIRTWNKTAAGGTFSVGAGATLKLGASTGGQTGSNFPSGFTTNTLNATSTVDYNAAGGTNQTIFATPTYGNLTLSRVSGATNTNKTATAALTMLGNLTIGTGATFVAGTSLTHNVGGNWTNNGTFSFTTASTINFNTAGSKTVSGSSVTAFNNLTVNKGTDNTNVLDVISPVTVSSLTLTNGTFKWSNSGTVGLSTGSLTVGATTGLWVNGGTVNVGTTAGSLNLTGLLRASAGTLNVGNATGNSIVYSTGSTITFDGGNVNVTGRISRSSGGSTTTYTQSSGIVTVVTVGSASASDAGFDIGAVASSFTMNGGSIVIQRATSNSSDYLNLAATNSVTGGTLQIGNASTPASQVMRINSTAPVFNLTINSTNSPTGQLVTNSLTVTNTVTLSGGTLNANNLNMNVGGNWTNNGGTFTPGTGTVTFNSTTATQSINGTAASQTFNNVTVSKNGQTLNIGGSTTALTVGGTLSVGAGTFDQSSADLTSGQVTVSSGATFQNLGTGDLTLSGPVLNSGTVTINANGVPCGDPDDILIRSSIGGVQRSWSGTGTFSIKDVNVQDQAGTALITVNSGTNAGNNGPNWVFVPNCTGAAYSWNGLTLADWNVGTNWTPTRLLPDPGDVLIIDGSMTPGPTITNVPTQTIAVLRIINSATPTLTTTGANTLTINGATGTDLTIPSGSGLTLGGSGSALTISIASGSNGIIGGLMIFQDGTHSLIGNAAGAITFQSGAICTTATGTYNDHPFGTGAGGDGTAGSVIFASNSNYFHNSGNSPFGSVTSPSVAVFQTGSLATFLTSSGFQASGRTYANLAIGKVDPGGIAVNASDSGAGNFQFDELSINSTGSADSSLTFTGSGTNTITIKGRIDSNGVGSGGTLPDVTLTAGSGGIMIDNPGNTLVFGNDGSNTRAVQFESSATVSTNTELLLSRKLLLGISQPSGFILTVNGVLNGDASGYVIGSVKRPYTGAEIFIYHVGTVNGYSPVSADVTAGSGDLTVLARQGTAPLAPTPLNDATTLDRYWTLTEAGALTAKLVFNYLQTDVDGNEANYRIIRVSGGTTATTFPNNCPTVSCVNTTANTGTISSVTEFSDWTMGEPDAPTAVTLRSFAARRTDNGVLLEWDSGFEVDNLGYNIYREENGARTLVTPSIVAGSALKTGPGTRLTAGMSYAWWDMSASSSAQYWLEDVDLNGKSTMYGPFTQEQAKPGTARPVASRLLSDLSASRSSDLQREWPAIVGQSIKSAPAVNAPDVTPLEQQFELAGQTGVKLSVNQDGWYRVTRAELEAAGLAPNADSTRLQLYLNGVEQAIKVGANGTVEFYGRRPDALVSDKNVYWLIEGATPGQRIQTQAVLPAGGQIATGFPMTVERRDKMIYYSSLQNGESSNIFGPIIATTPASQVLELRHLDGAASGPAQLEVALQGVSWMDHLVAVKVNGQDVGVMSFTGRDHSVWQVPVPINTLVDGNNTVTLTRMNGSADVSLVDYVRITYARTYHAEGNRLAATVGAGQTVKLGGFTTGDIRVLDVTGEPRELLVSSEPDGEGFAVTFEAAQAAQLVAFTDSSLLQTPAAMIANEPSSLNSIRRGSTMVIISHRDFRQAVEPLATLRRSQGLNVSVFDVEDIYDEFSYSAHGPQAIKDFLDWTRQYWAEVPKYVLLVGDSSWDPRNELNLSQSEFVPTKLIDTVFMEAASDDWIADFNNDGIAEMGVGRLPVKTVAETATAVQKIIVYDQLRFDPRRGAMLVSDTGFEDMSEEVRTLITDRMPVQMINRSSATDAVIRQQILDGINAGPRIVNYYGHGSVQVWTGAGLLQASDGPNLSNGGKLAVFTLMNCLNGYSHDAFIDSLGEALFKAENGGAVAVWASSGYTTAVPQGLMNNELYRQLFTNPAIRLGDAIRSAKAATFDPDVQRTWVLLGDPSMRVK